MRREHFPALVAFGGVVVDDLRVGQEHGLAHPVQAADQVEVLEVHEEPVVKKRPFSETAESRMNMKHPERHGGFIARSYPDSMRQ